MPDPWAAAALTMARGAGSTEAAYQFQGGAQRAIRMILTEEEVPAGLGMNGMPGKARMQVVAIVAAADLVPPGAPEPVSRPQRGDTIGVGTRRGWKVENVRMDLERVSYRLTLLAQD